MTSSRRRALHSTMTVLIRRATRVRQGSAASPPHRRATPVPERAGTHGDSAATTVQTRGLAPSHVFAAHTSNRPTSLLKRVPEQVTAAGAGCDRTPKAGVGLPGSPVRAWPLQRTVGHVRGDTRGECVAQRVRCSRMRALLKAVTAGLPGPSFHAQPEPLPAEAPTGLLRWRP